MPTLRLAVPKEESQAGFGWRAEFTFGNQDENLSQHVLVNKDGTIRVSSYNGESDTFMSSDQATNMLAYLEDIVPTLLSDPTV